MHSRIRHHRLVLALAVLAGSLVFAVAASAASPPSVSLGAGTCDGGHQTSGSGVPSFTAYEVDLPMPEVTAYNATAGVDVDNVYFNEYLYKWSGSSWVNTGLYLKNVLDGVREGQPIGVDTILNMAQLGNNLYLARFFPGSGGYYAIMYGLAWVPVGQVNAVYTMGGWATFSNGLTYCQIPS